MSTIMEVSGVRVWCFKMTLQELVLVWNKLKQDIKLDAVFKDKGEEAHPEKSCGYENTRVA